MTPPRDPKWNAEQAFGDDSRRPLGASGFTVLAIAAAVTLAHIVRELTIPPNTWREEEFYILYGLAPAYVGDNPISIVSHMFVHGSWAHLLMNVAVFLMVGLVLAQRVGEGGAGAARIAAVTLASGLAGALAVVLLEPNSESLTVGFSGAVCGVAGAYLLSQNLDWRASLRDRRVLLSAFWFLALNVGLAWGISASGLIGISWQAHLGGFIGGVLAWMAAAPKPPAIPDFSNPDPPLP